MREIYKGIWQEEIPLTGNPLKNINIYIIQSQGESMIIDTGFHTEEVVAAMEKYLSALDLDLSKTKLFLTHLHSDHTGMASYFHKRGVPIYMSKVDGALCIDMQNSDGKYWTAIFDRLEKQGLGEDGLTNSDHPGFKYRSKNIFPYTAVEPGDYIEVGDYRFEVVDEEGHTPGMVGLYEKDHKILICGDHILGKITPNITYWGDEFGDSLGIYLENLDKVAKMEIDHLLSSHRHLVEDVPARIKTLKDHHESRLQETREILAKEGQASVRTVTKNLSWDISAKSWDDFPKPQKFFAAGEGQSHLEHLVAINHAIREEDEQGIYQYSLTKKGEEFLKS